MALVRTSIDSGRTLAFQTQPHDGHFRRYGRCAVTPTAPSPRDQSDPQEQRSLSGVLHRIGLTDLLPSPLPTPAVLSIACGLLLTLSSSDRLQKVASRGLSARAQGTSTTSIFSVLAVFVVATFVYSISSYIIYRLIGAISEHTSRYLLAAVLGCAFVAFFFAYPRFGLPQVGGYGDQDDAVNLISAALLSGHNPYLQTTYLGNPISNLMGSGILGLPFYALFGSAAYLNPFLLVGLPIVTVRKLGVKFVLFVTVLSLSSLGFLESYILGGDYYSAAGAAAATSYWLYRARPHSASQIMAGIAMAVTCTTRFNLIPVAALVLVLMLIRDRARGLVPTILVSAAVSTMVLWWYIGNPAKFAPLRTSSFFGPAPAPYVAALFLALACTYIVFINRKLTSIWLLGAAVLAAVLIFHADQVYRSVIYIYWAIPAAAATFCALVTSETAMPALVPTLPTTKPSSLGSRLGGLESRSR